MPLTQEESNGVIKADSGRRHIIKVDKYFMVLQRIMIEKRTGGRGESRGDFRETDQIVIPFIMKNQLTIIIIYLYPHHSPSRSWHMRLGPRAAGNSGAHCCDWS